MKETKIADVTVEDRDIRPLSQGNRFRIPLEWVQEMDNPDKIELGFVETKDGYEVRIRSLS
jgi:hypothetical protein